MRRLNSLRENQDDKIPACIGNCNNCTNKQQIEKQPDAEGTDNNGILLQMYYETLLQGYLSSIRAENSRLNGLHCT